MASFFMCPFHTYLIWVGDALRVDSPFPYISPYVVINKLFKTVSTPCLFPKKVACKYETRLDFLLHLTKDKSSNMKYFPLHEP